VTSAIDHLVVTARSRDEGMTWIAGMLGVAPVIGGEHARMGTHNALVRLGDAIYLEVIAPNPQAPAPNRARWFELDRLAPSAPPRLAGWVARTDDIAAAAAAASLPLGPIETMTRGALTWRITIPEDGRLVLDGAAPSLIQWSTTGHPAAGLPDAGCALERLDIRHPGAGHLDALLHAIGFGGPLSLSASAGGWVLSATVRTPGGVRVLRSS
jgi:hypothetical protein